MNIIKSFKIFLISLLIISSSCAQSNSSYSTLKATIKEAVEKKITIVLRDRKEKDIVTINFKKDNIKLDIKNDVFIINDLNEYRRGVQFICPYSSIDCLSWEIHPYRLYNKEFIDYDQAENIYRDNKLPMKYCERGAFRKWWKSLKLEQRKIGLTVMVSF